MKASELRFEFVEELPSKLEEGTVYVSITFATAAHKCACGCGREVVTPFSPTDWKLVFDGVSISLDPSIGNWSFACKSHYWIRRNKVVWARAWSRAEIAAGRESDKIAKDHYFGASSEMDSKAQRREERGFFRRLRRLWKKE